MPRPHRRESESGLHHVMNRGVDHRAIFFDDVDRIEFGRRLASIHERFGVTALAYCLMGNHFHLLLRSPPGMLSPAMHHLTGVYSRHTNDRLGRDGPLFRGRFHSIPVESDAYLVWASRYIHRNPIGLPGVASARDYRWSSFQAYVGDRTVPDFLDVSTVLSHFDGRWEDLASFTEADDASSLPSLGMPSVDDVRRLVECAMAIDDLTHPSAPTVGPKLDRTLMTLLAGRCSDPRQRELLVAAAGHRSANAARVASRRAEQRLHADAALARTVTWVEAELAVRMQPQA